MSDGVAKNAIGYRHPPTKNQFQKGHSGNPSGRPKTRPSFKADLARELQVPLEIDDDGKTTIVTKQRAFIKSLTSAAIKNDMRAVSALLACMRHYGIGAEEPPEEEEEEANLEDLDALQTYIDNQRKARSRER